MTRYPGPPERVRLSVVAALVSSSPSADPATADESRLAEAIGSAPGDPGGGPGPDAPALADLLRLAEGTPSSGSFAVGLRQAGRWRSCAGSQTTALEPPERAGSPATSRYAK